MMWLKLYLAGACIIGTIHLCLVLPDILKYKDFNWEDALGILLATIGWPLWICGLIACIVDDWRYR